LLKSRSAIGFHSGAELTPKTVPLFELVHEDTAGPEVKILPPKLTMGPHTQEQQDVIDYAWQISKGDKRFIILLTTENGEFTYQRIHPKVKGAVGRDTGLCGVNTYWHPDIVNDSRFYTDWKWQLRECYRLYTSGTTFYGILGYDNNSQRRKEINAQFINL
jgi:hypothetical protein